MAQDLKKKLEDAGTIDCIGRLQEIAEEMFVRFYTASGDAAEEKGKNLVLMQEIQRLEKENGELKTELVDTEERYWKAHEEVEKAKKSLCDLVGQIAALVEENRKMKRELGERIATAPAEPRNDSAACECPKCGSVGVACTPVMGEYVCRSCGKLLRRSACGERFEVIDNGNGQSV